MPGNVTSPRKRTFCQGEAKLHLKDHVGARRKKSLTSLLHYATFGVGLGRTCPGRWPLHWRGKPFLEMGGKGYRNRRAPKTFGAASRRKCICSSFHREAVIPPLPPLPHGGRKQGQPNQSRQIAPNPDLFCVLWLESAAKSANMLAAKPSPRQRPV